MAFNYSTQSAQFEQILNAVNTVLNVGDGLNPGLNTTANGVSSSYINESYEDYRPRSGEPYEVTYGLLTETPYLYAGAGRLGHWGMVTLEVTLFTRLATDIAGTDDQWSRDQQFGALIMRRAIQTIFQDNFLFSAYDPTTHLPTGTPLTIEGLQQLESPGPIKPARSQSDETRDRGGYGQTKLYFQVKYVEPNITSVQTGGGGGLMMSASPTKTKSNDAAIEKLHSGSKANRPHSFFFKK